jgi:hypothetical protein
LPRVLKTVRLDLSVWLMHDILQGSGLNVKMKENNYNPLT